MTRSALILALFTLAGCGSGDGGSGVPQGSLVVSVVTSGTQPDGDGYSLTLAHLGDTTLAANDTIQLDVPPGQYTAQPGGDIIVGATPVAIGGVADNCVATGAAGHVVVADGGADTLTFTVTCTATTGSLAIRMMTDGVALDPDGYQISIDGGVAFAAPINAPTTARVLAVGDHSVAISGVVMNCAANAAGPITVNIEPAEADTLWWAVDCEWPQVAVRVNTGGPVSIGLVNPDGSNEQILVNDNSGAAYQDLAWSSDGTKLAYSHLRAGGAAPRGVGYLALAAPSVQTDLLPDSLPTFTTYGPRWSPTGDSLLLVGGLGPSTTRIYVMPVNGSIVAVSPDSLAVQGADWDPATGKIAFSARGTDPAVRLYVMNSSGSGLTRISPDSLTGVGAPRWLGFSNRLTFIDTGRLWVIGADGTGLVEYPIAGAGPIGPPTAGTFGGVQALMVVGTDFITGGADLIRISLGHVQTTMTRPGGAWLGPDWR